MNGICFELRGEPQGGDAPVEGAVDDLQFNPGERLAEALVHADAEGHGAVAVAVDVQPVGVGEGLGVAVGDVVGHDLAVAGVDDLAGDLDVLQRDSA